MSRFHQVNDPAANPRLGALYKEIVEHGLGADTPINWFTAQSARPDILATTWGMAKGILLQGVLPPTVKQMISMTIAMQNHCRYCAVAHTNALESMGVPTEVIQSCANDPELAQVPPPQRAILKFGLKTAQSPRSVTDADLQALRDHGLTDGEIMEVVMVAACSNFLNTWAEVSGILVDGEEGSSWTPEEEIPGFKQIRNSTGHAWLKVLYKKIVDASFGRNFPSLGLPPQPDDRTSRSDTATGGRAFLEGELPPTVNQIIIVRISTSNDCRYSRLTDALEAQGVPAEVIDTLTVDANPTNLPPVGRVVVELAGKSGANPRSISDEGFKSLRGYGLSIGES